MSTHPLWDGWGKDFPGWETLQDEVKAHPWALALRRYIRWGGATERATIAVTETMVANAYLELDDHVVAP